MDKAPVVLHTSDLHIGKNRGLPSYLDRYEKMLNGIYKIAKKKKVDIMLVVGDLFDRKDTREKERNLALNWLIKLDKLNIPVVVTYGNHDVLDPSVSSLSIFKILNKHKKFKNIHVVDCDSEITPFENLDLEIINFPDCNYKNLYHDLKKFVNTSKAKYKIMTTHGIIQGAKDNLTETTDHTFEHGREIRGNLKKYWKKLDYVALGDIHTYQKIKNNTFFCGSPIQHNFGEYLPKGVLLVDMEKPSKPKLIPIKGIKPFILLDKVPENNEWPEKCYIKLRCHKKDKPAILPENVVKTELKSPETKEKIQHELNNLGLTNGIIEFMASKGLDKTDQKLGVELMDIFIGKIS